MVQTKELQEIDTILFQAAVKGSFKANNVKFDFLIENDEKDGLQSFIFLQDENNNVYFSNAKSIEELDPYKLKSVNKALQLFLNEKLGDAYVIKNLKATANILHNPKNDAVNNDRYNKAIQAVIDRFNEKYFNEAEFLTDNSGTKKYFYFQSGTNFFKYSDSVQDGAGYNTNLEALMLDYASYYLSLVNHYEQSTNLKNTFLYCNLLEAALLIPNGKKVLNEYVKVFNAAANKSKKLELLTKIYKNTLLAFKKQIELRKNNYAVQLLSSKQDTSNVIGSAIFNNKGVMLAGTIKDFNKYKAIKDFCGAITKQEKANKLIKEFNKNNKAMNANYLINLAPRKQVYRSFLVYYSYLKYIVTSKGVDAVNGLYTNNKQADIFINRYAELLKAYINLSGCQYAAKKCDIDDLLQYVKQLYKWVDNAIIKHANDLIISGYIYKQPVKKELLIPGYIDRAKTKKGNISTYAAATVVYENGYNNKLLEFSRKYEKEINNYLPLQR